MSDTAFEFTRDHAYSFLLEVGGGNTEVIDLVDKIRTGRVGDDDHIQELLDDDADPLTLMIEVLAAAKLLIHMDWREPIRECVTLFNHLFERAEVDATAAVEQLESHNFSSRGQGPGIAYLPFREIAEAHGLRIVDLHDGSDTYAMCLVKKETADRWCWVRTDDISFIGDADFQFSANLLEAGITPHYGEQPTRQAPPKLPNAAS